MQTESDRAVDGGGVGAGAVWGCGYGHRVLLKAASGRMVLATWVRLVEGVAGLGRGRYKGPSLLDAIDSLQPPARDYSKPIVMPICDVIKLQPQGQVSACGKLEAGALQTGSKVQNPLVVLGC
ncbi:translation elongation factor EF1A/initiation factor IF2gamma family protein [Actinidia rufa]|uniref:Translation elongation factor EF1A/initiation factor IF2gamma family protein n=1 Tax=Actinidia rufa TaxID=165716 RepID=A0A7J0FEU1_9ERIC|nr:translation elongation factor EF1A/initiation factor IF2gamma family protein [Actinidia rufa]